MQNTNNLYTLEPGDCGVYRTLLWHSLRCGLPSAQVLKDLCHSSWHLYIICILTIRTGYENMKYETVHAKSLQSCPTLCNPMDDSLPGSSIHGILQAWILEWVVMPSSRGSSQPRDRTQLPVKLSSSAKLMVNFSIQNAIPFLVQHVFPSRLRSIKERGLKLSRICGHSRAQRHFHVPRMWFGGKSFQPPRPSLNSKGQMQIITD